MYVPITVAPMQGPNSIHTGWKIYTRFYKFYGPKHVQQGERVGALGAPIFHLGAIYQTGKAY